jgi:hypothetical protein
MPGTTSPDDLVYPVVGDTVSPRIQIAALATSVQAALTELRTYDRPDRVTDYYGPAGSIGTVTPKNGDTYRESDSTGQRHLRVSGSWVPENSITRRSRTTALNFTTAEASIDFATAETAPTLADFSYGGGSFTTQIPGRFRVFVQVQFLTTAGNYGTSMRLQLNAVTIAQSDIVSSTGGGTTAQICRDVTLATADVLRVRSLASNTVAVNAISPATDIEIVRL